MEIGMYEIEETGPLLKFTSIAMTNNYGNETIIHKGRLLDIGKTREGLDYITYNFRVKRKDNTLTDVFLFVNSNNETEMDSFLKENCNIFPTYIIEFEYTDNGNKYARNKKFKLHWIGDNKTVIIEGITLTESFNKNYGGGAISALDYYEEIYN